MGWLTQNLFLDGPVLEVADDEDEPAPALHVAVLAPGGPHLGPLLHVSGGALGRYDDAEGWNNETFENEAKSTISSALGAIIEIGAIRAIDATVEKEPLGLWEPWKPLEPL